MGVAGLHGALAGYAVPLRLEKHDRSTSEPRRVLIIDGPALAYHVYYMLLSRNGDASHPLRAMPSYEQLGQGVVDYLDALGSYGLRVKHIFFDGQLPEAKRAIRLGRLQKYLDQLRASRLLHPSLEDAGEARATAPSKRKGTSSSVSAGFIPPKHKTLPAPPFLVPAVIEGLKASKDYADMVEVVPCEADLQCSDPSVCAESDYILTSDSDLVLQAPAGRIIFFNSIEAKNPDAQQPVLTADTYNSLDISTRLGLPASRLVLLGYYLNFRQSDGLVAASKLAKAAAADVEDTPEFRHFAALYRPFASKSRSWSELFNLKAHAKEDLILKMLNQLDARIAEYVFASKSDPSLNRPMYLPVLLDDPTRSSAWQPSSMVRQLAYSVWSLYVGGVRAVDEYDRRGTRLAANRVECLLEPAALQTAEKLTDLMGNVKDGFPTPISNQAWCSVALVVLLRMQHDSGKVAGQAEVQQLIDQDSKSLTWAGLHLHSQLEGMVYSLRMLGIILHLVSALDEDEGPAVTDHPSGFKILRDLLSSFPGLCKLLVSPGKCIELDKRRIQPLLGDMYADVNKQQGPKKPKKRKNRSEPKGSTSNKRPSSSNPFDVLAEG